MRHTLAISLTTGALLGALLRCLRYQPRRAGLARLAGAGGMQEIGGSSFLLLMQQE